jgi:gamma-F420-2:alpha-L-glutamate ligase
MRFINGMKALILVNGYCDNPNNSYKAKRLSEEFEKRGVTCEVRSALEMVPVSDGNTTTIPHLEDYRFAIDLDKDIYLADAIAAQIPLFNSAESLHLSDDKMASILALRNAGIKAPLTIPAPLCYIQGADETRIQGFLDEVEKLLGYPLVYKECHGSMGQQVKLIHDRAELDEVYHSHIGVPHLYEKFLSKHQGHDFRVMVVGKQVVAVMDRVNENDFRSNIALGGKGLNATDSVPTAFKDVALKACEVLKLDYAGIDVAISDGGMPMFLEANGNAFFTEIEKVTGVNVAGKLADHIIEKLYI